VNNIQHQLSFPHYSKEIIQCIEFCKNTSKIPSNLTRWMFRSGILGKTPLKSEQFQDDFDETELVIIEIASRISYEYNGYYAHHILTEEKYGFPEREKIVQRLLTDEDIEADVLRIRELCGSKPFIVVSHIYTRKSGKRYELVELLRRICLRHVIPFFDPMEHLSKEDPEKLFKKEDVLAHYTDYGHMCIKSAYKEFIENMMTPIKGNEY